MVYNSTTFSLLPLSGELATKLLSLLLQLALLAFELEQFV